MQGVAANIGCRSSSLREVLQGGVGLGFASALGASREAIQDALDGIATDEIAALLGCTRASLQEFLRELTPDGRRGFIVGLACYNRRNYASPF